MSKGGSQPPLIPNNGSQSTRHSRQVSHNNTHDLFQIYSARNAPSHAYQNM